MSYLTFWPEVVILKLLSQSYILIEYFCLLSKYDLFLVSTIDIKTFKRPDYLKHP